MIPKKELEQIKKELEECQNPFFFYHDDPDGICSFLLLRHFKGEGDGHIVKPSPELRAEHAMLVPEGCDKVFVLDVARVLQEFVDSVKVPVIIIDHHDVLNVSNCKYFNPRIKNPEEYTPVSSICYEAVGEGDYALLIGMIGTMGDLAEDQPLYEKFYNRFGELVGDKRERFDVTFNTKIGKLIRTFEFNLKGKQSEIKKSVSIITRSKDPLKFLDPETKDEKFIYEKYERVNEEYEKQLNKALKIKDDPYVFIYEAGDFVLGGDLGKEIPYKVPGKRMYIICREKAGYMICSLRTHQKVDLNEFLKKAFKKVEGSGGGHPVAAGCGIKKSDFEKFLELAREF